MPEIPLANGDFETASAENWTLSGYSEVATDQWAANNNTNALSLWLSDSAAADGSASYSVKLTAGTYRFSYDISGAAMDSGLRHQVTAGEVELTKGDSTVTTGGWDVWQTVTTADFVLTETTQVTFTLSGTQPAGYFGDLDNLKLYGTGALAEKTPEPVEADIYVPRINGTGGDFMRGMDISSVLSILNSGATFKDFDGNVLDGQGFMNLLADAGTNWVRIRVWNDPFDATAWDTAAATAVSRQPKPWVSGLPIPRQKGTVVKPKFCNSPFTLLLRTWKTPGSSIFKHSGNSH